MAKRVLVVDDDMDFLRLMKVWLQREGYEVAVAVDGLSGLSAARKDPPDLVVLDVNMPAGGGATTLERMRKLVPLAGVPIVVLTGTDASTAPSEYLAAGADGFVRKMDGKDEILAMLAQALASSL